MSHRGTEFEPLYFNDLRGGVQEILTIWPKTRVKALAHAALDGDGDRGREGPRTPDRWTAAHTVKPASH
jgi:hypothetical protein